MPNPAATQQWTPGNAAAGPAGGTKPTNEDPVVKWVRETRNEATSLVDAEELPPLAKSAHLCCRYLGGDGRYSPRLIASSHRRLNVGTPDYFRRHRLRIVPDGASAAAVRRRAQVAVRFRPPNRWCKCRRSIATAPPVAQAQPLPQRDPLRESPTRRRWRYQTPVYNPGHAAGAIDTIARLDADVDRCVRGRRRW